MLDGGDGDDFLDGGGGDDLLEGRRRARHPSRGRRQRRSAGRSTGTTGSTARAATTTSAARTATTSVARHGAGADRLSGGDGVRHARLHGRHHAGVRTVRRRRQRRSAARATTSWATSRWSWRQRRRRIGRWPGDETLAGGDGNDRPRRRRRRRRADRAEPVTDTAGLRRPRRTGVREPCRRPQRRRGRRGRPRLRGDVEKVLGGSGDDTLLGRRPRERAASAAPATTALPAPRATTS